MRESVFQRVHQRPGGQEILQDGLRAPVRTLAMLGGMALLLTVNSCASTPHRAVPHGSAVHQLQIRGVHVRGASEGGIRGCVPLGQWPTAGRRVSLEKCFLQIPEGAGVHLRLAREDSPFWTLDLSEFEEEQERRREKKLDELPSCLKTELARWDSPLEVVFVSPDPERGLQPACFSARLKTGSDRFFWSTHSERAPSTAATQAAASFSEWLDAWLISPFFDPEKSQFYEPVYLPERLCRECLGEAGWRDATDGARTEETLWPQGSSGAPGRSR